MVSMWLVDNQDCPRLSHFAEAVDCGFEASPKMTFLVSVVTSSLFNTFFFPFSTFIERKEFNHVERNSAWQYHFMLFTW